MLKGMTPYELLYVREANLDHLRIFSCICYARKLPIGYKFDARERIVVMIGYSETQKVYRLYDLDEKTFFVNM